jgi:hypothetical protein
MSPRVERIMPAISPKEYLGFAPGDDRKLASWSEITGYLRKLSEGARRIRWVDMGESTEGRPFYYLTIASPETLAHLDEYTTVQARLADPRGLDEEEAAALTAKGKTIVLISCSIHATEVGASQMSVELAYELETREDPRVQEILDNVILLFVPSLNPDGLDMVVDWYKKTLGTPYEGTPPPFIYQKYAGHDNNRDWFMLNLVENRLTVEKIHNVWHPNIVYDLHQMGDLGFRLFLPPFMDPYDPNVDYILRQEVAELGLHMMGEVLAEGKTGVSCLNTYDAFAPSRAYQHYHGGVRILSEAASVRLATPVSRKKDELRPTRDGADPREAAWNHPAPWPGGEWHLRDIVDYDKIAAFACLSHAAKNRGLWVSNFYKLSKRAVERKDPYAYVLPAEQRDPVALHELLKVLADGLVEIHKATDSFEVDGAVFGKGSYVVKLAQPYGAYAKTLLEIQKYPDLRQYPGGPPKLPYDVTGHTLPLMMGVKAYLAKKSFDACLEKVDKLEKPQGGIATGGLAACACRGAAGPAATVSGGAASADATDKAGAVAGACQWLAIPPAVNASAKVVNDLLARGREVYRTAVSFRDGGDMVPAGTFVVPASALYAVEESCRKHGVTASELGTLKSPKILLRRPRVAVYKSYRGIAGEGWLRYVLEEYGFPYESVTNQRVRKGCLRADFDTIIIPSQPAVLIAEGNRSGMYPPEYTGGFGPEGKDAVAAFIEQGGTAVFIDAAAAWAVSQLGLPATNVVADKKPQEFFVPGSILKTIVDTEHPLGFGLPREMPVAFEMSSAWDAGEGAVVARYPATDPLLSGWLLGGQFILNKAALVEFPVGEGRAVLVGFHPYFRAQARGTYKTIFNAIYLGSSERV